MAMPKKFRSCPAMVGYWKILNSIYWRKYRKANRKKRREYDREYYAKNRDKRQMYAAEYYWNHWEERRKYAIKYRTRRLEEHLFIQQLELHHLFSKLPELLEKYSKEKKE